ncbi:uncharacterized protein LOC132060013 [Lycium ferocissimum]|uniref:uncharacterized protein LOC132060013 n=1 Tax=Lycium ferocissimum TaxID=112874 RepID=UPI002815DFBC|nr:uncharacterized protein LOC132060013 [Lycium ferocissimum]XP_059308844.1 uncharacterized protein LOC132060013 [Lycium ferocissimum]XP_059308845.1 uncharacterized protein LOC132060013 [Lycium ferocissimum]XP_059308847.1 uncharacterized protein LOC132060013 [Lycium ferocissimum]XP_059308848.1 uncharacterized protein LOC132060013 [Lycium ferocissimum]XP_059308849.1 uncharacterized protein LOC132060013 [Lycium ferocissimum]
MENRKFIVNQLLKDKKLWFASFLVIWAAGLQGHMMWLQRQDSFKKKFGELNDEGKNQQELADN